ncbi:MAG: T9SS type A sorting domain-containing protein, partial [Ignavibacteria bacterium]|nr:T9SS type A sorting domain-containing protein [Ignavibacteria bacterium]
ATELNNQGFEIERTTTDDWEKIGFVNGNGTTTEMQYYSFTDNIRLVNNVYKIYYRLKQIDFDGTYEYSNEVTIEISQPDSYLLKQNYPNPFNPSTIISFTIPIRTKVVLKVYDVLGTEVAELINDIKYPGRYEVEFNSNGLPSGIYFYTIQAGKYTVSKKMILLK